MILTQASGKGNPDSQACESIHEDESGALWLATQGGLDRFDRETETLAHYRVQEGLVNEYVVGMMQDRQENLRKRTFSNRPAHSGIPFSNF
jgi:ligand-binding sensor domain-containing protein